jgi:hypothetical protein
MKKLPLAFLALLPVAAVAADVPSSWKFKPPFTFPKWESGQVPHSLNEMPPPPLTIASNAAAPQSTPATSPDAKLVSRMPIVPAADVDPKMVKAPAPGIDYKLIVKTPKVESAR